MDILSIIGIILAFTAIIGGNLLEGGNTEQLFQLTAFLIVVGGTMGAVMLQTSIPVFLRALSMLRWIFFTPRVEIEGTIEKLFSRKGLQLLVDGNEPETIRDILETEIQLLENFELQAARVYEAMGGYSPTIGILGAVMGLIHVMNTLADPSKLGSGIATAFVATIYGVGLANLFLLPAAGKLKAVVQKQILQHEMMLEGIVNIAEGENPRNIESKLQSYLR